MFAERPADLPWPSIKHAGTIVTHGKPYVEAAPATLVLDLHEIQVKDALSTGMFSWKKVTTTGLHLVCLALHPSVTYTRILGQNELAAATLCFLWRACRASKTA